MGCLRLETPLPLAIPPGESVVLTLYCEPAKPGRYEGSVSIFTSVAGQTDITLTVEGDVVK